MDLNLIYVGYACTAINYAFYCVSRFKEDKRDILFLDLIAKIFTVIGLYCLDSLSGAYSMCLMFLICIACYIKQCKNWKLAPLFWLFQILFIIILFKTYIGISSILVFISCTLTLVANWWLKPQNMRLVAVFGCVIYLAYQISIANWAGLLEIFSLASNAGSYLKYRKGSISE